VVLPQLLDDLFVLGQSPTFDPVRVDDPLINIDVKQSRGTLLQIRRDAKLLLDRSRQTGGCSQEPSLRAVNDLDLCRFP